MTSPRSEAIKQKLAALYLLACFGVLLAGIWLMFDQVPFSNERTVWLGWCPTALENGKCPNGEESGNPTTYRADQATSTVTHWTSDSVPGAYRNCAIRDAGNWSCHIDDTYEVAMLNDKIGEKGGLVAMMYYQVPKWRWYWLRLHTKTF